MKKRSDGGGDFDDVRASRRRDESFLGIRLALHVDVVPILVSGCKEESGEVRHFIVGMQSTGAALSKPPRRYGSTKKNIIIFS